MLIHTRARDGPSRQIAHSSGADFYIWVILRLGRVVNAKRYDNLRIHGDVFGEIENQLLAAAALHPDASIKFVFVRSLDFNETCGGHGAH